MKKKYMIYIIALITFSCLFAGYFIYKNNKLKELNNVIIPKVKYTCTSQAVNNEDLVYYTKIVIEGTNAGRIVNYYSGLEILYKNDSQYNQAINELATDNDTLYQNDGENSIFTYNKSATDENNNVIISKTMTDMNNKNIKCVKEKISS